MKGSQVAIVGVGETAYVRATEREVLDLMVEACRRAIAEAGLQPGDIDGMVAPAAYHLDEIQFALGIEEVPFTAAASIMIAGAATVGSGLQLAQMAIETGQATHVLVPFGLKCSKPGGPRGIHSSEPLKADLEMPLGYFGQPAYFAAVANRYEYEFGLTEDELASVSISTRKWATLTPSAQKRDPLDMAGYLRSPMIATPLRVADCCLMTDGAAAYVVSSLERAKDMPQKPVVVAGVGTAAGALPLSQALTQNRSLLDLPARQSAERAFAMAGVDGKDLDLAQIYDCFTPNVALQVEMLGLAEEGQGFRFFASGAAAPGGSKPVNTSGGHLAGGYVPGINLLIEGVRQLRGERGEAQVPGARICGVAGLGGSSHATAILTQVQ